jgi:hypothetical protein
VETPTQHQEAQGGDATRGIGDIEGCNVQWFTDTQKEAAMER